MGSLTSRKGKWPDTLRINAHIVKNGQKSGTQKIWTAVPKLFVSVPTMSARPNSPC